MRTLGYLARLLAYGSLDETALIRWILPANGTMFDIGAHTGSTAIPLARRGWTVHAFEPDATNRRRLLEAVSELPNVTIVPLAVSNQTGTSVIYSSEVSDGISSLQPFHPSHKPAGRVSVTTIRDYIERVGVQSIDFLKIDTEGYDLHVLEGVPWSTLRPQAIMCEFEDRKTLPLGYTYEDLADMLTFEGYSVLVSEWYPVIEYGRRHRWRCLRPYPHRLNDDAAWGNLIAVSQDLQSTLLRLGRIAAILRGIHGVVRPLTTRLQKS